MKKWKKHTLMHYIMCSAMLIGSIVFANDAAVFAQERTVTAMPMDQVILPDLYNTGPQVSSEDMVKTTGGILPCVHDGNKETLEMLVDTSTLKFNFGYKHKDVKGTLVFDNLDLSQYELTILGADQLKETGRSVKLIFNNCTFRKVSTGRTGDEGLALEFNNCTFVSAVGSNLTFNHCRFGGGINDRMNLFVDCFVNDSYIYNPSSDLAAEGEIHVDGVQIFGDQAATSRNIHYNNCRFEVPSVTYPNAPLTYVNACIMVQLEYSKGENMSFTNCYLNGGGYSLYAHSAPGAHDIQGQQITDIRFKDLHFGCAGQFGWLYPKNPEIDEVVWNKDTWNDADSVYVGTVTRDQNKNQTYLSVSNDTNQNRYFRAYTSSGHYYDYMIEACPLFKEFRDQNIPFEAFPFDKQYTIPEYCDWVAVFEVLPQKNTFRSEMKQVRFQNWTNQKTVTIPDVTVPDTMSYTLENGVLTITGTGYMPEFDADQLPWKEQKDAIRKVVFEKDSVWGRSMDSISANAFADCVNLEEVVLPKNLKEINAGAFKNCEKLSKINFEEMAELRSIKENAFENCISIKSVKMCNLVKSIGKDAFSVDLKKYPNYAELRDVYYEGSLKRWLGISFGNAGSNPMYAAGGNLYVENTKLATELDMKTLGENVVLPAVFAGCKSIKQINLDGVEQIGESAFENSAISGEIVIPKTIEKTNLGGKSFAGCQELTKITYNGSANIPLSCFSGDTKLEEFVFTNSVVSMKNLCFCNCVNLKKIVLPNTITYIGQSSFLNCTSLEEINIPAGVTEIINYTFDGCSALNKISFQGVNCPTINKNSFRGVNEAGVTVCIPENAKGYTENEFLKKICKEVEILDGRFVTNSIDTEEEDASSQESTEKENTSSEASAEENNSSSEASTEVDNTSSEASTEVDNTSSEASTEVDNTSSEASTEVDNTSSEASTKATTGDNKPSSGTSTEATTGDNKPSSGVSTEATTGDNKPSSGASTEVTTENKNPSSATTTESNTKGETVADNNKSDTDAWKVVVDKKLKGTSFKKYINKKGRKLYLTWKKRSDVTGYEIQYSTSKKFKSGTKTKIITKATKTSVTIKKLKKSKKYYVRIRAYKNGDNVKYVSKWSKKKTVTIKK